MRSNQLILTDAIPLKKAEMFARGLEINLEDLKQYKASHGWLQRFKKRQHIKSYCLYGEAESAPITNLEGFRKEIQEVLKNYNLEDIFNIDETGLFYRMAPSQTLGTSPEKGHKKEKSRVTVLLTCNATGTEKLKPLVIGNVGQPRCYKNINMAALLHVQYFHNKKAWIRNDIWKKFILSFNSRLRTQNCHFILPCDNASPHAVEEFEHQLENLKVYYLPPNTTAHLQPADVGIICNFKVKYKKLHIQHLLSKFENDGQHPLTSRKFTVRQAIETLLEAWNQVTTSTIAHCWQKTKILSERDERMEIGSILNPALHDDQVDIRNISSLLQSIPEIPGHQVMDVDTYVRLDDSLPILECLNEEEIIEEVLHMDSNGQQNEPDEDDDDEDDQEQMTITAEHCQALLPITLAHLEQGGNSFPEAENLYARIRSLKSWLTVEKIKKAKRY